MTKQKHSKTSFLLFSSIFSISQNRAKSKANPRIQIWYTKHKGIQITIIREQQYNAAEQTEILTRKSHETFNQFKHLTKNKKTNCSSKRKLKTLNRGTNQKEKQEQQSGLRRGFRAFYLEILRLHMKIGDGLNPE